MGNHSLFSPSAACRWIPCPGSLAAEGAFSEEGVADQDTQYTAEGTAAHYLASTCLENDQDAADHLGRTIVLWQRLGDSGEEVVDEGAAFLHEGPTGWVHFTWEFEVDRDMAEAVQVYLDYCRALGGDLTVIERRVDLSPFLPREDQGGTMDYGAAHFDAGILDAVDYKHGKGHQVDAYENPQLKLYALGLLHEWEPLADFHTVRLHVVQPRMGNIDTWEMLVDNLLAFAEHARESALLALSPHPPRVPGDEQCTFCKAKAECKPLAEYIAAQVAEEFEDLTEELEPKNVHKLSDAELARLLKSVDIITGWCSALKDRAMQRVLEGSDLEGFKLVRGYSQRQWIDKEKAEKTLRGPLKRKVSDIFTRKLVSPTQAEKLVGKTAYREKLEGLVAKPPGKPTLVKASDKRPAISPADLLEFEDLTQEEDG